ncbi:MAG TPA: hypothetical protein VL588_09075, partial [Bdellovibrionota bacterium]|nr:hypothetical protein [Bdellovibrionota bacterium]
MRRLVFLGVFIAIAAAPAVLKADVGASAPTTNGAERYYRFGIDGQAGWSGQDGRAGQDGRDAEVTADGTWQVLQMSGTDGGNGGNAMPGGDAYGCTEPYQPDYDLEGAWGGRGGNGGDGGRGGSGGDLLVHFDDLAQLRSLQVFQGPGRGGDPGYANTGGNGCRCYIRNWSHTVCHDTTDEQGHTHHVCNTYNYYCQDGQDGGWGYQGSRGSDGVYGRILLVPGHDPVPAQKTTMDVSFGQIASGPFTLSRNRWFAKAGAHGLFAAGSDIRDDYQQFDRNIQGQYGIEWRAPRPIDAYVDQAVHLQMDGDFVIRASLPDGLWLENHEETVAGVPTLVVTQVVTEAEAKDLVFTGVAGSGTGFEILVTDRSGVSDLVKTAFRVKIGNQTLFWYPTR